MELAKYIDHTLLKTDAQRADVAKLIEEAKAYHFASVCVSPIWVSYVSEALRDTGVNYTHKRPLHGHCAPPLQKPSQSVRAFGLTSWGFMVSYTHKNPLCGHCAPPLMKVTQSVCALRA